MCTYGVCALGTGKDYCSWCATWLVAISDIFTVCGGEIVL